MARVTRTLHPLPFEHLEPKRFEDLARQLVYDFRRWRQLEATGRSGSDDGFDARGFEAVEPTAEPADDDVEDNDRDLTPDRLWLIQCKREKSIGPARLRSHLRDIPQESLQGLYGVLFIASCDFSKATRDAFRDWCRDNGISECHIWGRAEIEDMLYQPKNDNLLFAYFGISLGIRRASWRGSVSREISLKRKLDKILGRSDRHHHVLVRDPSDKDYPWLVEGGRPRWLPAIYWGFNYEGAIFMRRRHLAYLSDDERTWDIANVYDDAAIHERDDPWRLSMKGGNEEPEGLRKIWLDLPAGNRAWLQIFAVIPYEKIIAVDDVGDDVTDLKHILCLFENGKPPFSSWWVRIESTATYSRTLIENPDPDNRIAFFPEIFRKPLPLDDADDKREGA